MATKDFVVPEPDASIARDDSDAKRIVPQADWTVEEERKAKWKLDLIIMPLLTLGFFCLRECDHVITGTLKLTEGQNLTEETSRMP
ncbi:alternative sulfate transporter [Colletotrichum tofieldiae]|nr:alternative sulfate transporter [Colletotrichum tofieldiae]